MPIPHRPALSMGSSISMQRATEIAVQSNADPGTVGTTPEREGLLTQAASGGERTDLEAPRSLNPRCLLQAVAKCNLRPDTGRRAHNI